MRNPLIVAHGARPHRNYPPNTLKGVFECSSSGFSHIEVDITAQENGEFFLFHNEKFDLLTNKKGNVFNIDKSNMGNLWYTNNNREKTDPVSSLSELVKIIETDAWNISELQLDFKIYPSSLITEEIIGSFLKIIDPVKPKIRITSCADWIILKIHELDTDIKLGFDPQFYIDFRDRASGDYPPFKKNHFGYSDDHPISMQNWDKPKDYLESRAVSLLNIGSVADIWYIRYSFIIKSYQDGFDWVRFLHTRGIKICAWTIDITEDKNMEARKEIKLLMQMGIDRITTNTPAAWRKLIENS